MRLETVQVCYTVVDGEGKLFSIHTWKLILTLLSFFTSLTSESTERNSGADKGVSLPVGASAIGLQTSQTYRNKNQDIEGVEKL